MSNAEVIKDLANVRQTFLRESLGIMVRNHGPEDIVTALASVMETYAAIYARRTGDYSGANQMRLIAAMLDKIDDKLADYDGGEP